ncbi:MAG: HEAT repeat domain-containing protein [Planctomycetota bacterium]|jgi:HEAT repeat protein
MRRSLIAASVVTGLAAISLPAGAQDMEDTADAAVADLKEAFKSGDEDDQYDALRAARSVTGKKVTAAISRGLNSKSRPVKQRTIRILGKRRDEESLKALHALYKGDRRLSRDEETFALVLKEIGRHGDPSSLAVLAHKPFKNLTIASGIARIYGASRIRTNQSLAAVMEGRRKGGGELNRGRRNKTGGSRFDAHFRVTLAVLTGVDKGNAREDWEAWWRDNKKTFKVSPERPEIPASLQSAWEQYWGESYGKGKAAVDAVPHGCPVKFEEDVSEERVKEAIAALEEAFAYEGEDADEYRVATIEAQACVMDPRVIDWIAVHLKHSSDLVRIRAVNALGWTRHPRALELMMKAYKDVPDLYKDEDLFAQLLKSIGRSGKPQALKVLADKPFKGLTLASGTARIMGVGRIRDNRSVGQLMDWLKMGGSRKFRGGTQPRFMLQFRTAMASLTGQDLGSDKQAWLDWWKSAEKTLEVTEERPDMPRDLRQEWENYWGEAWK